MLQYHLAAQLHPPHLGDVKAVLSVHDDCIVTASRDSSVAVWYRQENSFRLDRLLNGHHAYVNSLAHIPAATDDQAYIASGGNSSLILLHALDSSDSDSQHCLLGHSLNVCALSFSPPHSKLISGSWDCTARVWSRQSGTWQTEHVLQGHEGGVWGVAIVDDGPKRGSYLTGGRRIRSVFDPARFSLWNEDGRLAARFKGSPEPVRGLAMLSDELFASACNDGLIRIWDLTGSVVRVLRGHGDYVYHVETNGKDTIVSCGEDHTARVWMDEDSSIITHPCQTVWAATFLHNGDVVTGGSDGKVRVWTRSVEKAAPLAEREAYDTEIQNIAVSVSSKTTAAPSTEQTDLTIDIDISDDEPPIPLLYRAGSDPRATAEDFGRSHGFSDRYIDQIEAFIRAHLGQQ